MTTLFWDCLPLVVMIDVDVKQISGPNSLVGSTTSLLWVLRIYWTFLQGKSIAMQVGESEWEILAQKVQFHPSHPWGGIWLQSLQLHPSTSHPGGGGGLTAVTATSHPRGGGGAGVWQQSLQLHLHILGTVTATSPFNFKSWLQWRLNCSAVGTPLPDVKLKGGAAVTAVGSPP